MEVGVKIKRLGFGTKADYNTIKQRLAMSKEFRYSTKVTQYQRLLVIDRKILFFDINGLFFQSTYKLLVKTFLQFFNSSFKKEKHGNT